jgi:arsenite/tail-anchored protein-transporting ATPase
MILPRVLFVTGKGGTGKSTVAAALALALARVRPTILADLDGCGFVASLLGLAPGGQDASSGGGALQFVPLSPRAELQSFIERIVPLRAISRRMLRSRTFGYVTAALPGLEAFMLVERLRIMGGDAALEDRFVVIDAPASGSALELLSVPAGLKGIAPAGSLNRLANAAELFLADPTRFGVVITVTPEKLAIREAVETAAAVRERLGIATIAAIMNRAPDPLFETPELAALSPLTAHGELAIRRSAAHENALFGVEELRAAGLETITLPMLFTPAMGAIEVDQLSRELESMLAPA